MKHYVKNGEYIALAPDPSDSVMVTQQSDLQYIPEDVPIGTIAFTAGFKKIWQKDIDGSWDALVE